MSGHFTSRQFRRVRNRPMPTDKNDTRERIRAMVREVLKAIPDETEAASPEPVRHLVVNSLREKQGREFDRDESAKSLITEDDLRGLDDGAKVRVALDARLTPLAQDIVNERQITLIRKQTREAAAKVRSIAIGADHGGFALKEQLKKYLESKGLLVTDLGTSSTDAVDYPDFAHEVAKAVGDRRADIGIVIDGAGIGSAMAANKVPGVRAAACYSVALAKNSREHNGANVLTLGSGQNSFDEIKVIVNAFMSTEISEDRHKKRVEKIDAIQRRYSR